MGRLKAAGAEVIQVTPTKLERARFYVKNFPIPFPYLCDPDLTVHRAWGLGVRSHSLLWYLQKFQAGSKIDDARSRDRHPEDQLRRSCPPCSETPTAACSCSIDRASSATGIPAPT